MAGATDLTTLSNVRAFMQIDSSDTSQDALISALITRASDEIMRWTQREFVSTATVGTARTFKLSFGSIVDLAPYDLRTLTQIRVDTDGLTPTPVTLTADEYRLLPLQPRDGVYNRIELIGYQVVSADSTYSPRNRWRTVEATGTWGFAAVPSIVEQACIITVLHWIRTFSAMYSQTFGDSLDMPDTGRGAIPAAAKLMLDGFRKRAPR